MRRWIGMVAVLGTLAFGAIEGPPDAAMLLREAKAGLAAVPAVTVPEYLDYIGQRERAAGLTPQANQDLRAAFEMALTLGPGDAGKAQIEFDAVDALLEEGAVTDAEALAIHADAGRTSIFDRAIPDLVAAGDNDDARKLWAVFQSSRDRFPFRAAGALACGGGEPARALVEAGERAAGAVEDLPEAERALDFLMACAGNAGSGGDRAGVAGGAVALWNAMAAAPASNWEVSALRARITALVKATDRASQALLQAQSPGGPAPQLRARSNATAPTVVHPGAEALATPLPSPFVPPPVPPDVANDLYHFQSEAAAAALYASSDDMPQGPSAGPSAEGPPNPAGSAGAAAVQWAQEKLRAHPELASYDPVGEAELAVGCFEMKQMTLSAEFADTALAVAEKQAAGVTQTTVQFGNSPILQVFGLIAQIDFGKAAARATQVAPLMRPLVLAEVARVAGVTPATPGKHVLVVH